MIVFPAIDILDGNCVRLFKGDYEQKTVYSSSPADVAKRFVDEGCEFIHSVDLNGAKFGEVVNDEAIKKVLDVIGNVPLQIGGGIRTAETVKHYLDLGVNRVILGTAAVNDFSLVEYCAENYPHRFCLSLDVLDENIMLKGWLENSRVNLYDYLLKIKDMPVSAIVATDISRDGAMVGAANDMYKKMMTLTDIPIIASGGISSREDLLSLKELGLYGAITGKAVYEGKINLREVIREVR
ncbi:MAG: 1-(5-phosphoribosyl)-5-[Eubacteriaceae bacterium]|nr:1-(5-phosphoribosyl)-5-[(5-phosphoribosylamino)methylideneamino]imidazole-4-carboxamide isomerase [Eubacteriaceae bacterium]